MTSLMRKICSLSGLPAVLAGLVGVCFFLITPFVPRLGDDAIFTTQFNDLDFLGIIDTLVDHWSERNGRMADALISPLFLYGHFPRPILMLANGMAVGGMLFLIPLCAGLSPRRPLARLTIFTLAIFTLGWTYLGMELTCFINYVWPSALALALLYVTLIRKKNIPGWLYLILIPLAICAGAMHEALGTALIAGTAALFVCSPKSRRMPPLRIAMLIAMSLGAIIPLSGIHIGAPRPDDALIPAFSTPQLLLSSCYYPIILTVVSLAVALIRPVRMLALIRSSWIFFATAALTAIPITIFAGYPGRPGWFGQIFALISLAMMCPWPDAFNKKTKGIRTVYNVGSIILFSFCAIYIILIAVWQIRLGCEFRKVISSIPESDGIVYLDFTRDAEVPLILRYKVRGVPDHDSRSLYLGTLAKGYNGCLPLVILPEAYRDRKWAAAEEVRDGVYISLPQPAPQRMRRRETAGAPIFIADFGGITYVEEPFPLPSDRPGPSNGPVRIMYAPLDIEPTALQ